MSSFVLITNKKPAKIVALTNYQIVLPAGRVSPPRTLRRMSPCAAAAKKSAVPWPRGDNGRPTVNLFERMRAGR